MDEAGIRRIMGKIAQEYNMPFDELRAHLQTALDAVLNAPSPPQGERVHHMLMDGGKAPTPESFFLAFYEASIREKETPK